MSKSIKKILSTRPISETLVGEALLKNIKIETLSFIETTPIETVEVQQEIELAANQIATVVFTSMNAVDAVTTMLEGFIPEWNIYCMGYATKELVKNYFGESAIAGTADNASELAEEIIENEEPDEVIFFCGNKRRDELPGKLKKQRIEVNEIIVYKTENLSHRINIEYDGILFFSPSAVESFFAVNKLPQQTIVFAIGKTTKETVSRFCMNKIVVSKLPGKDQLVEQAIAYGEWAMGNGE
jgi:uroporphyrinogen-III synthase